MRKQRHKKRYFVQAKTDTGYQSQPRHSRAQYSPVPGPDRCHCYQSSCSATVQIRLYCTTETEHFKFTRLLTAVTHPRSEKAYICLTKRTINKAYLCKIWYQYQSFSPNSKEVGTVNQKQREKLRVTESK